MTSTVDHIVHLSLPGSLEETTTYFESLGFNVIVGGVHADGLTENSLIVLLDGSYIELIAFTHPVDHYPPGSTERSQRELHRWAGKRPGWIDYANLGTSVKISEILNNRAEEENSLVRYHSERPGGRKTPDGKVLKWRVTFVDIDKSGPVVDILPFFCGDVTPRQWRVPHPTGEHPNKATKISHIRVLTSEEEKPTFTQEITTVFGSPPVQSALWSLKTHTCSAEFILDVSKDDEESECGRGLFEIGFSVGGSESAVFAAPGYGRVVLVPNVLKI